MHGQNIDDAEQHLGREVQSLPPFVGIVLSKCKSSDDIPKVLKEIRADFEDFRNCCERFEKQLNAAKTVKEQVDAVKEYKTFWSTLVKKYTDKRSRLMYRFLDIASESEYEKAADSALDNLSTTDILKDLNLGKVAGKTGIAIWDKLKERKILNKFKGVVNLWDLLENSPTIQTQLDDIERIFKTKVDRTKLNRAKTFLKSH